MLDVAGAGAYGGGPTRGDGVGSGTNRKFWSGFGSRSARRKGTKTTKREASNERMRLRMKAARAEAARRSNG